LDKQRSSCVSRGEGSFVNLPRFGASLYDSLTRTRPIEVQFKEVGQYLTFKIRGGRLLDIGTGPGRLLFEIHRLNPDIELFGLDISDSMVQLAKKNLSGIRADLRQGNIRNTNYKSNFFDAVTCTGSFYLWDHPEECLEEIHRILKENQSAYLFETYRDFDNGEFRRALKANLQKENIFRKLITPFFLEKQLKMAYRTDEVTEIVRNTSFADTYTVDKINLSGLPIWLRIALMKKKAT
jgi:ubiquinone/menaquinone biosynthesis C-methylase UbiE